MKQQWLTSERWRQVKQIFQAAIEFAPAEREAYLTAACDADPSLRADVELLLAAHQQPGDFLDVPAFDLAAGCATRQGDTLDTLTGQFLNHYRILSLLGRGGMGEVYLAQDAKLNRRVAIKLLPARFTAEPERVRRFIREARAASALNHPNIITIHEIGEAAGLHFIAEEFVEGQTLRQLLASGQPELNQTLEVALQIAAALTAAHEAGIIHRDIKPENVMVRRDGYVKVLDFGLAKLTERPVGLIRTPAQTVSDVKTDPGVVMGTARYMSPEQARGQEVDARTDIFSFGVVLYELLTRQAPFAGATPSDVIAALLKSEPAPLASYVPAIPRELERIVGKCLEKERERRYSAAQELLVDLKQLKRELELVAPVTVTESQERWRRLLASRRSLAISALVMLVVAALSYLLLFRGAPTAVSHEIKSLAVLPLENLSGDPAQEYFADGMTEALIGKLAQIRALSRVISRTSVMGYKGSRKSLPEIAAELKVDAVIEGTVQRSGGRVLVTVKLIPAATDSPMWSREYNRDLSDVLKLQSEVARAVADEIRIQVTPEERARLTAARNINPQTHEAYLLGRHHLRTNEADLRQAIGHFEQAIQLAPDYAAAYAGLSQAWERRGIFGAKNLKEALPLARDAAVKAVALDPQLAEAHIALGFVKTHDWDWAGAEQEFTRALELDPNMAEAHRAYADLLMQMGRHAEAIREIERAEQLDPLSSYIQSRYGRVLYRARKYEEAAPHLLRAIELDPHPGNSMPYWILAELYVQIGRYDEALASFKKAQSHGGRALDISVGIAAVYARMGKPNEARRMLAELKAQTSPASFSNTAVAKAYTALGDKDEAFKVLFRLVEERNNLATTIKADPPFDSLHSDPRWKELLRRMNFPTE